ncbi:Oxysterol-binding protein-domain-containing protein [Dimargaris cristalligena]|uniref:Oxysterol-binding protein-domain-containing protein n=1 Tax=Dimargaris cristalligena TaxID=215637 RepID=A0A4P9ZYJ8_9FUNG|nr:Oxysterol-binding protein-domain-containing protein [Dimargaris cristalligena]|eukprot:RKP38806.1 Oxysterol-binding protein-domain-containing protein [Dimargaris cristalligena]
MSDATSPSLVLPGDTGERRKSQVSDLALKKFQLVEALRSGNQTELTQALRDWSDDHRADSPQQGAAPSPVGPSPSQVTPLHLAIQFASRSTIEFILSLQSPDLLNCQDNYGWTALHHAAKTGRGEVVRLLLNQPDIDDLIIDHDGRDPIRIAKSPDVAELIKGNRLDFVSKSVESMHDMTLKGNLVGLDRLFQNIRFQKLVDINTPNLENNGNTVLHEAVETKNFELVKWWCSRGADVFVRNENGKLPAELTTDARTLNVLEHAPVVALRPTSPGKAPRLQGYLLKWTNFASGYKRRYFVLENGVLSYYKDKDDASNACRGAINLKIATINFDAKDQGNFEVQGKGSVRYRLRAELPVEAKRWILALTQSKQWALETIPHKSTDNLTLATRRAGATGTHPNMSTSGFRASPATDRPMETKSIASEADGPTTSQDEASRRSNSFPGADQISQADSTSSNEDHPVPPHEETLDLNINSLNAQMVAQEQLFEATIATLSSSAPATAQKLAMAYKRSVADIRQILRETVQMGRDREQFWLNQYQRETERQNVLAESFRSLILEQDQLEKVMRAQRQRTKQQRLGRTPTVSSPAVDIPAAVPQVTEPAPSTAAEVPRAAPQGEPANSPFAGAAQPLDAFVIDEEDEDDDQFYDAEDVGELVPDILEDEPAGSVTNVTPGSQVYIASSYRGYPPEGNFRTELGPGCDKPPAISFWSILKNSIGKDLTKISMPVVFNEPNSMLQRMAEDMEYSELLDMAVRHSHSSERILFVTAWAMSNYSSTMGRIAKPFNPLLGETFEYVRPDKTYRYVSEQVSHHPPISACYCDGPNYNFYAEVNVKSKFYGKSFEICPLGISHVELKVPLHMLDPQDPAQPKVIDREGGFFIEHYSWKKVITSVQGLIAGSPWMEHYGDMDVVNHRTGETCRLTFKQNGWRGNNLYVLEGKTKDAQGNEQWELAGKWNERLIARRINKGSRQGPLTEKDLAADADVQSIASSTKSKPILLWRGTPFPDPPLPFNLTRFAVTLNEVSHHLDDYLCPTDSRFRPDQRAMEKGHYDEASDLKTQLEEHQRARRREREEDPSIGPWQPRWFSRSIEPDTNEPFWQFNHEYWQEREQVSEGKDKWTNVEPIFEVSD